MAHEHKTTSPWGKRILLLVLVAAVIAAFTVLDVRQMLRDSLAWVDALGSWGPIIFIGIYAVAAVLFVPGSALTLGAGAVFGVTMGSVLVSIGSTLAAAISFLIGRYVARDWVAAKVESNVAFKSINDAVKTDGWKLVALTRLSPVFPFTLLNYAYGLTPVKFWHYVLASWIAMMPGTVMYVYLGSLARAGAETQQRTPAQWVMYGVGLIATIIVTVFITRIAKAALAKRTNRDSK